MSFISFRKKKRVENVWVDHNYGKSRLDFYIVSNNVYESTESVFYGEKLNRSFDHKEVVLRIGKKRKSKESINIQNKILEREEVLEIGEIGLLDCVCNHLAQRDKRLSLNVGRMQQLYIEKANIKKVIRTLGSEEEL